MSRRFIIVGCLAVAGLLIWTAFWHLRWQALRPSLHWVPALFLGLLLLLILAGVGLVVLELRAGGLRSLVHRRILRGGAWFLAALVTIVVLFYSVELWRGKRAWAGLGAANVAQLHQAGQVTHVQPADDFGDAPFVRRWRASAARSHASRWYGEERLSTLSTNGPPHKGWSPKRAPWLDGEREDLHAWVEYYQGVQLPPFSNRAEAAAALIQSLQRYSDTLKDFQTYTARPGFQFGSHTPSVWAGPAPEFGLLRDGILLFSQMASAQLTLGNTDAAFDSTRVALALARYSVGHPQTGAGYWIIRNVLAALQPVWEGLSARKFTARQIAQLAADLRTIDVIELQRPLLRAEATALRELIDSVVPAFGPSTPIANTNLSSGEQQSLRWIRRLYPRGWSLQDQAAIELFYLAASGPDSRISDPVARTLFTSSDPFFPVFVTPRIIHTFVEHQEMLPFAETMVRLARAACAVEQFRLTHGKLPNALEELVPAYLQNVPADAASGAPLVYRIAEASRYSLYGIGRNRVDDGGKPLSREVNWQGKPQAFPELDSGDWTWPWPAESDENSR